MIEILTGIISGAITGTGMGGGTILILVLSVFMGINQHTAQGANLIFFIPTSIIAIIVSIKDKLIKWQIAIPIAVAGTISAIIGAKISANLEKNTLKKYFGIFLACIALYEIYSIIKQYIFKRKTNNKKRRNIL